MCVCVCVCVCNKLVKSSIVAGQKLLTQYVKDTLHCHLNRTRYQLLSTFSQLLCCQTVFSFSRMPHAYSKLSELLALLSPSGRFFFLPCFKVQMLLGILQIQLNFRYYFKYVCYHYTLTILKLLLLLNKLIIDIDYSLSDAI